MADIVSTAAPLHVRDIAVGSRWTMRIHPNDEADTGITVETVDARWVTSICHDETKFRIHIRREDFEKNARPVRPLVVNLDASEYPEGTGHSYPHFIDADRFALRLWADLGLGTPPRVAVGRIQRALTEEYIDGRNAAIDAAAVKARDMGRPDIRWEINHLFDPPRGGNDEKRPPSVSATTDEQFGAAVNEALKDVIGGFFRNTADAVAAHVEATKPKT